MENHRCEQIYKVLLSMNISCCNECPKTLKRKLLRMPGVDSISIDLGKNLILVTGTVDPTTLLNKVKKLGKRVTLVPTEEHHSNSSRQERHRDRQRQCGEKKRVEEKEEEEPHKCEAYEPPKVDERVCRDFHCKNHPRSRPMVDKVSAQGASLFRGFGPFYGPYMNYGHEFEFGYHQPRPHPQFGYSPRPFY